jgi:hypothetical protein
MQCWVISTSNTAIPKCRALMKRYFESIIRGGAVATGVVRTNPEADGSEPVTAGVILVEVESL